MFHSPVTRPDRVQQIQGHHAESLRLLWAAAREIGILDALSGEAEMPTPPLQNTCRHKAWSAGYRDGYRRGRSIALAQQAATSEAA
jgi:hypothetical protein